LSEGRVIHRPLAKSSCNVCGYGFHSQPISSQDRDGFYDETYDLGLRDAEADQRRAQNYVQHIETLLARHTTGFPCQGMSIVEFGCGTGALLECMTERWMAARSLGIEPAASLVRVAQARVGRNVAIRQGFAESGHMVGGAYDLCVSVNVIEHALDPVDFLAACRASVAEGGVIVAVCPDGDRPNSELLFRDHVSSFSATSFALVAARAGLRLIASAPMEGQQSGFKIFMLKSDGSPAVNPDRSESQLSELRENYLKGWQELEQAALSALGTKEFAIFGIGEYADLLHAYCPGITDRARFHVVDNPVRRERDGRKVIETDEFMCQRQLTALAAVHPRNWSMLKRRFEAVADRFFHPYQFCSLRSQL
jgi:2-polyprenyl-3-methyl-5-hydroxy-6-metoxy-1,4-benzoquinol methylase